MLQTKEQKILQPSMYFLGWVSLGSAVPVAALATSRAVASGFFLGMQHISNSSSDHTNPVTAIVVVVKGRLHMDGSIYPCSF